MMTNRIQEFALEGRNFVFIDFSGFKGADEYRTVSVPATEVISKYPPGSLMTITDISDIGFNLEVQRLMTRYMEANGPYVKYGAVIGVDGIKKAILKSIFLLSKRSGMTLLETKEEAIAWLLKQP
jgi:hypothetical protein